MYHYHQMTFPVSRSLKPEATHQLNLCHRQCLPIAHPAISTLEKCKPDSLYPLHKRKHSKRKCMLLCCVSEENLQFISQIILNEQFSFNLIVIFSKRNRKHFVCVPIETVVRVFLMKSNWLVIEWLGAGLM